MHGCMVDLYGYRATLRERNFIERIEAAIIMEADLAVEIM